MQWNSLRRFGVELEFCMPCLDDSVFDNNLTINEILDISSILINKCISEHNMPYWRAQRRRWERTSRNDGIFVCKLDSSCGYEICSPPLRGKNDLENLCIIIKELKKYGLKYNDNCGLHVHVDISDFSVDQIMKMMQYWLKIEHHLIHGHPYSRKTCSFCAPLLRVFNRMLANHDYNGSIDFYEKIYSYRGALSIANMSARRKTVELRLGEMTLDYECIKNRIIFMTWFVDLIKILPQPKNLNLITMSEMLDVLCLNTDLSEEMRNMRNWIVLRAKKHIDSNNCFFIKDFKHIERACRKTKRPK